MSQDQLPPSIRALAALCGREWPTIARAAVAAAEEKARLSAQLSAASLIPADTAVTVFGSLARGEWTSQSDLDWTLLVNGQVDVRHAEVARQIAEIVAGRPPGPTAVFGGLTFSHSIVHFIGGDSDTNTNTTRRILLLLESRDLAEEGVRLRVIEALLARYVGEDLVYHEPRKFYVPRFLLNDYVRYWRTMAVDSANRRRERADGWALRNIKLRLSRKLIFSAGLWACLSCRLHPSEELRASRDRNDQEAVCGDMTEFLLGFSRVSPLETLASAFLKYKAREAATYSFDAYETFLAILDDAGKRDRLKTLKVADARSDEVFEEARNAAAGFQRGLTKLLFETDDDLMRAAQKDGVF